MLLQTTRALPPPIPLQATDGEGTAGHPTSGNRERRPTKLPRDFVDFAVYHRLDNISVCSHAFRSFRRPNTGYSCWRNVRIEEPVPKPIPVDPRLRIRQLQGTGRPAYAVLLGAVAEDASLRWCSLVRIGSLQEAVAGMAPQLDFAAASQLDGR
eukprot:scpid38392/ scgid25897/ 